MKKAVDVVAANFNTMRTGRANPAILDRIMVGAACNGTLVHALRTPYAKPPPCWSTLQQGATQPARGTAYSVKQQGLAACRPAAIQGWPDSINWLQQRQQHHSRGMLSNTAGAATC